MTSPSAKKRLPRWPPGTAWVPRNKSGARDVRMLIRDYKANLELFTRWLAAYDARQKRGKP